MKILLPIGFLFQSCDDRNTEARLKQPGPMRLAAIKFVV